MSPTASYDYARLIAAFGIVVFHAGAPGAALGYAALPFFLMLMISLGWASAGRTDFARYLQGRGHRLLLPWLVWSGIYGGLKLAECVLTAAPLSSEFAPHMWLTGPALHLWFLPFAFAACLALWPLARLARALSRPVFVAVALGGALGLQALCQTKGLTAPLAQWAYVAPAVCLGIALAALQGRMAAQLVVIGVFAGLSAACGWIAGLGQITLAAGVMVGCAGVSLPQTSLSKQVAAASMGIYLAHPLIFSVLERGTPLVKDNLLFASLAGAMALCLTLGHHQISNWWAGAGRLGRNNTILSEPA